ncbi:hypothetical protein [Streptomyces sp. NPDC058385]|uniref:hypothetical protein n=1 Tax=Streptomyces sp. NPDC058385 TaxID=3346473 RepID=UPI003653AEAD
MPGLSSGGTVTADVTLDQYEDHAKPSLDAFQAAPGRRLVAAKFTILSTGDAAYGDTGNMGAKLVDWCTPPSPAAPPSTIPSASP